MNKNTFESTAHTWMSHTNRVWWVKHIKISLCCGTLLLRFQREVEYVHDKGWVSNLNTVFSAIQNASIASSTQNCIECPVSFVLVVTYSLIDSFWFESLILTILDSYFSIVLVKFYVCLHNIYHLRSLVYSIIWNFYISQSKVSKNKHFGIGIETQVLHLYLFC